MEGRNAQVTAEIDNGGAISGANEPHEMSGFLGAGVKARREIFGSRKNVEQVAVG